MTLNLLSAACWTLCLLLLLTDHLPANESENNEIGFVISITGEWRLNKNTSEKVVLGEKIPPGALLQPIVNNENPTGIVVSMFDESIQSRYCPPAAKNCAPLKIPAELKHPSLPMRASAAVAQLFSGTPERYRATLGRDAAIKDGVVLWKNETLDLSQLFEEMPPGNYHLRFESLTRDAHKTIETQFEWKPNSLLPAKELSPGLYRLVLLEYGKPLPQDAWILIDPADNFVASQAKFKDAVDLTTRWSGEVPAAAKKMYLRAYLEFLSHRE